MRSPPTDDIRPRVSVTIRPYSSCVEQHIMFMHPMEILGTHLFLYCPNMTPDGVRADNMRSLPDRVHHVGKLLQIQTLILIDFNN